MFKIEKRDESTLYVTSDDSGSIMELNEHFSFFVDGYRFMPRFKAKMWDGKINIYDRRNATLPYGLLTKTLQFANSRGYKSSLCPTITSRKIPSKESLTNFVHSLDIRSKGERIYPRDYQIDSFVHSIMEGRALVISPTGSGKSLVIYLCIRWYLENCPERAIIVVPTTSLVEQMTGDFADYASNDKEFDTDLDVHKIYSGKEKYNIDASVIITTWQSAVKLPRKWFTQFGMVIGDEAHLFKAKSLNTIMGQMVNAPYRIGTTGTLDDSVCNELVLIGHFGPTYDAITTAELIANKTLADLNIKCIVLKHEEELSRAVLKLDYQKEIGVIVEHPNRNRFITNLAVDLKGNTLVLFNLVKKHGKPLYELIKEAAGPDRKVFYVSGEVKADDREKIRELTENETDAIIVASSGVFSTGINIKELHNIIFAAPNKSQIRVLQSIGRGLRKSITGVATCVYDIADNFSIKKRKNYTMKHAIERIKIYNKQGFKYTIHEIDMDLDDE